MKAINWCKRLAFFIVFVVASINAETSSSNKNTNASSAQINRMAGKPIKDMEGMSPGLSHKMSFMALATSKIDDSETKKKAAIVKQFQKTFRTK
jgi:hypothetical protein